jgi:2-methylcitrate dehydratase
MALVTLQKNTNQALKLAEFAKDFMNKGKPSSEVIQRVKLFHTDSVLCGISALALKTNAPTILREEALNHSIRANQRKLNMGLGKCFGSDKIVLDYKAICANISAVREWDSNGTVFGYREESLLHQAGEFGHNDFYPVVIAAALQNGKINGKTCLKAMVLLDEIRGRLAESFSLKTYKVDHVVHGAIASIVTYGTLLGATPQQIEHGIGMFMAHYIPFRAIRAGHQLSDSKGASAAISTEVAIMSLKRAMAGFVGPKDIFRNPEAIFRLFTKTEAYESPFDLLLGFSGDNFSVMGMHFKLGLYEHQSAGAIQGLLNLILKSKFNQKYSIDQIKEIKIVAYEPAFGIIGDPAKRTPTTRQSADHSMVYIISTIINKAYSNKHLFENVTTTDDLWKKLILLPNDYAPNAIFDENTKKLISKIKFEHGGPSYDKNYPKGIPTSIKITAYDPTIEVKEQEFDSGFIMFPAGHAKNTDANLLSILQNKFNLLANIALHENESEQFIQKLDGIDKMTNKDLRSIYNCDIKYSEKSIDE